MYETFLQKIPLFAELPADDLSQLCEMISEVRLEAGQTLFNEGDVADMAYILHEGELVVSKLVDGREIQVDVHQVPGVVIGESALLEESMRLATIRARQPSLLLGLSRFQVQELLAKSPTAAQFIIRTLTVRSRGLEDHVRHEERMARLGTMTAGLAHELNNPAAAVMRSAGQLRAAQNDSETARLALEGLPFSAGQQAKIMALMEQIRTGAAEPPQLDVLLRSDREAELEDWLADRDMEDAWELTAALVNLGLNKTDLEALAVDFTAEQLPVLVRWLAAAYTSQSLVVEIMQGAGRIVEIVQAMKSYVYLDQTPVQNVDVQAGLEDTLVVLGNRLTAGITVRREYAADLPRITAYGSDLNQVWTNIITNALDALDDRGEIVIRTRREAQEVVVEIEDNGPGIAAEHLPKLFDPFFTTRPPGAGAGLGLNICYSIVTNHQGQIKVTSEKGQTVFQVRLPVDHVSF
jgi:signal transduction histidine kinase